jgi:hypothetical protein
VVVSTSAYEVDKIFHLHQRVETFSSYNIPHSHSQQTLSFSINMDMQLLKDLNGPAIPLGSYPKEISDDIRALVASKHDTERSHVHTNGGNPTTGQGNSVLGNMVFGDGWVSVDDSPEDKALFTHRQFKDKHKRRKKTLLKKLNPSPTLLRYMDDEQGWIPLEFRTLDR